MENTRVALLESVREVLNYHYQMNIWLNGHAGVGKTSIVFTVAEEMKRAGRLAATFFFLPRHARSVEFATGKIIPTIAYQLALNFPSIRDDIVEAIKNDETLLRSDNSCDKQVQELVIKPLRKLSCEAPYAIVIDGPDECLSAKEVARLLVLLAEALSGPDLPIIHLIFTSRPEAHIRTAIQARVHEISLTTLDDDTVQDVRFFLQASLDRIRTTQPTIFGQPPKSWPSEAEFETLAFKTSGLFVYAAVAINFISTGRDPQQMLDILLLERSTVGADIDQLYRQIIAASENPLMYCRLLASIIRLNFTEPLVTLQQLFHEDKATLAAMLGSFSPVILNPPDDSENVEIYHTSLRDFIVDPLRSKDYYVDDAHAHEHLACCCLALLNIRGGRGHAYAFTAWGDHLSKAYPSNKLRHLLNLFSKGIFIESDHGLLQHMLQSHLRRARDTCSSLVSTVMFRKWCLLNIDSSEVDQELFGYGGRLASC